MPVFPGGPLAGALAGSTPQPEQQKPSLLGRIGKGLVSFGTGIPQIDLDTQEIQNRNNTAVSRINEANAQSAEQGLDRDAEFQQVIRAATDPSNPDQENAMRRAFEINPEFATQMAEGLGLTDDARIAHAARRASIIRATPYDQRQELIFSQAQELLSEFRDPKDTLSLLQMTPEEQDQQLMAVEALGNAGGGGFKLGGTVTTVDENGNRWFETAVMDPNGNVRTQRSPIGASQTTREGGETPEQKSARLAKEAGDSRASVIEAEIEASPERAAAEAAQAAAVVKAQEEARRLTIGQTELVKEQAVRRATARTLLPSAEFTIGEVHTLINEVVDSPHLPAVLGFWQGELSGLTSEQRVVLTKIEQLQGAAFLDAFQSLKGGGTITEVEGTAATKAKTRILDRTVTVPAYRDALRDLDASFQNGLLKLQNESKQIIEGDMYSDPETGEVVQLVNGKWVRVQ